MMTVDKSDLDLHGKAAVITGATSGIGLAVARALLRRGSGIIGTGSTDTGCTKAAELLRREFPNGHISFVSADMLTQREVRRLAAEIRHILDSEYSGQLWVLINNAGCVRSRYMTTEDGYEHQFALNHLAGFLLTYELFPYIVRAGGRMILTGSNSHSGARINWNDVMNSRRYGPLKAYKQTKLCNLLFAEAFNSRFTAQGIRAYVVDPGLVRTEIGNKNTGMLVSFVWSLRKKAGTTADVPARTFEWLCSVRDSPEGLYYHDRSQKAFSRQVTSANADMLFDLSEKLCGISYAGVVDQLIKGDL